MPTSKKKVRNAKKKVKVKKLTRLQIWNRQLTNLKRLMKELDEHHQGQGSGWIAGMKRHYEQRINLLLENKPKPIKR